MILESSTRSLHRIWLRADVMAASLGINVVTLALPIVILQMYDRVLRHRSLSTLVMLTALTLAAFAVEFALRLLRAKIMAEAGARYEHREQCRILARLLATDINSFKKDTPGTHAERFQGIQSIRAFYCQAAALIADIPFIVLFVIMIAIVARQMAIVPVVLLVVFAALGMAVSRRLMVETGRRERTEVKRHNFLVESIGGIATVKALAAESLLQRRHERLVEDASAAFGAIARVNSQMQSLAGELAQAASIITVAIGAYAVVSGALTIGGLAATTILTGRLLQPVLKGLGLLSRYPFIRMAEDKLQRMEEFSPQLEGTEPLPNRPRSGLHIKNLSFRYPNAERDALRGLNLDIPPGHYIAITGETSSGRSTLLKLLSGLMTPTEGSVRYNGVPLALYNGAELRRHIALMPTTPTIYAGTLLENLTLFVDGPVKRRAHVLCRLLGLSDFVAGLSRGLDTQFTGNGDIPMGIAQRISIIRSLAQNPRVILFDTANAALDHDSDRRLLAFFASQKRKRSAVFITDRPSYLKICDTVYELDGGQLRLRESRPAFTVKAAG